MLPDPTPFHRVVVATDLSAGSADALARAVRLPLAAGAILRLVHVVPRGIPTELRGRAVALATERLRALEPELGAAPPGTRVERVVLEGPAHVEVIRNARAWGAELVVLGRHGRRRLDGLSLGSTAERVLRKGDVPVLVVRAPPAGPYTRAVAAVDLSEVSGRVIELARALLTGGAGELDVVHAFHIPFEDWLGADYLAELRREQRALVEARTQELTAAFLARGLPGKVALSEGDPRVVVLREVALRHGDLLVTGTHARAGLAHALLGSVAEWLVRASPCDVAVTRPSRFTFELP